MHLHDTPARTAAAFALGVFFSFSPFLGLQIVVSMAIAFVLRLNRAAVFAGLNANLPWFIVPWYAGTTFLAARTLGFEMPLRSGVAIEDAVSGSWAPLEFLESVPSLVEPVIVPFLIGPTVGAAVLGGVVYVALRSVLVRRASRRAGAGQV